MLPTSSMGDIAFLLIIFFMLASNFMKTANVEAEDPSSPDIDNQEPAQVSVVIDEAGDIWLQGAKTTASELSSSVQDAVGEHRDRPVHVRIHKTHKRSVYMPVLQALSDAGVRLMLTGVKTDE